MVGFDLHGPQGAPGYLTPWYIGLIGVGVQKVAEWHVCYAILDCLIDFSGSCWSAYAVEVSKVSQ